MHRVNAAQLPSFTFEDEVAPSPPAKPLCGCPTAACCAGPRAACCCWAACCACCAPGTCTGCCCRSDPAGGSWLQLASMAPQMCIVPAAHAWRSRLWVNNNVEERQATCMKAQRRAHPRAAACGTRPPTVTLGPVCICDIAAVLQAENNPAAPPVCLNQLHTPRLPRYGAEAHPCYLPSGPGRRQRLWATRLRPMARPEPVRGQLGGNNGSGPLFRAQTDEGLAGPGPRGPQTRTSRAPGLCTAQFPLAVTGLQWAEAERTCTTCPWLEG